MANIKFNVKLPKKNGFTRLTERMKKFSEDVARPARYEREFKSAIGKFKKNLRKGITADKWNGKEKPFPAIAKGTIKYKTRYKQEGGSTHRSFGIKKSNLTRSGWLIDGWFHKKLKKNIQIYLQPKQYKLAQDLYSKVGSKHFSVNPPHPASWERDPGKLSKPFRMHMSASRIKEWITEPMLKKIEKVRKIHKLS